MEINFAQAFVSSFFATAAFAILFQAPKKTLPISGIIGAIGWVIFITLRQPLEYSSFNANFIATVVLALLSELSARLFKQPATVFVIPGIIPLVPGLGMYKGMAEIISNSYENGMNILLTACTDSAAIALGMMVVASIFRVIKISKENKMLFKK